MTHHITEELDILTSPSVENEKRWVDHLRKILAESSSKEEDFFDASDKAYQSEVGK